MAGESGQTVFREWQIDKSGGTRNGWIYIVTSEFNLPPAGSDADVIITQIK